MTMDEQVLLGKQYIMNTYNRLPIVLEKGEGSWVYDTDGNAYLDFVGGIAVNCLGHGHPVILEALQEQAQKMIHCSNLYWIPPQIALAKILVENSCLDKAFFCNSGAEANEAAIKLARKWGKGRFEIISAQQSFHGRTMGALAATGQEKYQKHFMPVLTGFRYGEFNNLASLAEQITENTCAIILEPVQGEGGVNEPSADFLMGVRKLCDQHNLLLILDEVQTGIGRTGLPFAYQHYGIEPDILTLAKGLGGGVPVGAMLAKEKVAAAFEPGDHASTFGGNPLVTHVAFRVCETVFAGDFLDAVTEKGQYFRTALAKLAEENPHVGRTKGKGLMVGLELTQVDAAKVVARLLEKKILANAIGGSILRFVPALTVEKREIDLLVKGLQEVLQEVE